MNERARVILIAVAAALAASLLPGCAAPAAEPDEETTAWVAQAIEGCHDDSVYYDTHYCSACHSYTCYLSGSVPYRGGEWCENGAGGSYDYSLDDGSTSNYKNWSVYSCADDDEPYLYE
jgi:hypothetical protein